VEYVPRRKHSRLRDCVGTGSLRQATIRNVKSFPDKFPITECKPRLHPEKKSRWNCCLLNGNISRKNGEIFIHCHTRFHRGWRMAGLTGGHLVEGCMYWQPAKSFYSGIVGLAMSRKLDS